MEESPQTLQGEIVTRYVYLLLVVIGIVVFTVAAKANWNTLSMTPSKVRIKEWIGIVSGAVLLHIIWRTTHPDIYAKVESQDIFWLAHVAIVWAYAFSEVAPNNAWLRRIRRSVIVGSIIGVGTIVVKEFREKTRKPTEEEKSMAWSARGILVFETTYSGWTDSLFVLNSRDTMLIVNVRQRGYDYKWIGDGTKIRWVQRRFDGTYRGSFFLKPPADSVHILISIAPQDEINRSLREQRAEKPRAEIPQKSRAELIRERITTDSLEAIRDSINRARDKAQSAERRRERDSLSYVREVQRDSVDAVRRLERAAENLVRERRSDSIRAVRERSSDSVRRVRELESRNRRRRP